MMVGSLEPEVQMVTSLRVYAGCNQCLFCLFVCLFFSGKNIEVIGGHLKNYMFYSGIIFILICIPFI